MSQRAVIYARCSTEEESQKDALVKQAAEARECVAQKGWILVDSYIESRSGTSTKGRSEYKRLYEDLETDKFDIIVIKSQDRLMRNTKDWYLFVDRLTMVQKQLYMYIEGKFYSTDDGLLTGIKAILAEEYSRELSKKINNAHYNRQKTGVSVMLPENTYGLKKMKDKSIVIDEAEAKVIKEMFELYAAGYGARTVADILAKEGIRKPSGKLFASYDIRRIIRNPMYMGTVVMRRVHYDFESKRRMKVPDEAQFVHRNRLPAIISEKLWESANEQMDQRSKKSSKTEGKMGVYRGKSPLSGKIRCGICGGVYYRSTRIRYQTKEKIRFWSCCEYLERGKTRNLPDAGKVTGCNNIHLDEHTLYEFLKQFYWKREDFHKKKMMKKMEKLLKEVLSEKDVPADINKLKESKGQIMQQMNVLVDKLLDSVISDHVYQRKQTELEGRLKEVETKISELESQSVKEKTVKQRMEEINTFLWDAHGLEKAAIMEVIDAIEKIVVYPGCFDLTFRVEELQKILEEKRPEWELQEQKNTIRVEIGNTFDYFAQKQAEREKIVEIMKETPSVTAKEIANQLGISQSSVNYKIKVLKKEGKIRYQGAGGHGKWEIQEKNKFH